MAPGLDGMQEFAAVVEAQGFRAAAERLGVSGPAVSKAVQRLERRLGVALLQRTTRSIHLTDAGRRFYAAMRPALDQVEAAVVAVGDLDGGPRGTLRLNVTSIAESVLRGPLLVGFLQEYPEIQLEITVSDKDTDIVAEGYDAGVRLGEVIDQDMHVVAASGEQRLVVVGAPSYFASHPVPGHPRDLAQHACINFRASPEAAPYRWEFTDVTGHDFAVSVPARVVTNDVALILRLARAGAGLTVALEELIRPEVEAGHLVAVLEAYSTPFLGYYLYYPQRRQASPALRALLDYLRRTRAR